MRVEDIEYVIAIAQAGAIGRAAQQLGISQPALSKALTRIEADLKTRLFERQARGVRLSDEGRVFLEHARRVVMHAADARHALRDLRQGSSGVVRLGVGTGVPSELITDACADAARQGQIRFVISAGMTDSLLEALRSGDLDIILSGIPQPHDEDLRWTALWPDPMVPYVPRTHPLAGPRAAWTLPVLAKQAWVLPTRGTIARARFENAFTAQGLAAPVPLVESRASGKEVDLALALNAVVLMPLSLARDARVASAFECIHALSALRLERTIALLCRRTAHQSPVVERFMARVVAAKPRWFSHSRRSRSVEVTPGSIP